MSITTYADAKGWTLRCMNGLPMRNAAVGARSARAATLALFALQLAASACSNAPPANPGGATEHDSGTTGTDPGGIGAGVPDSGSSSASPGDGATFDGGQVVLTEGGVPIADGGGLNPALPPGQNFDLSTWELDLPTNPTTTELSTALVAGFTDAYFFTGSDGAMVMWCPLTGGRTANAHYPRSELREVLNGSAAEWAVGAGTADLVATVAVNQLPPKGTVIVGQIHEGGTGIYPLVKLLYESGTLVANVQLAATSPTGTNYTILSGIALTERFSYAIHLVPDGTLSVSVNNATLTVMIDPSFLGAQLYFKAGSYPQEEEDAGTDGSRVSFYALSVSHSQASGASDAGPADAARYPGDAGD